MINRNPPAIPPTISPVWAKPSQISFISSFFLFTYVYIHKHSSLFYYRNIFEPVNLLSFENSNFCNVPISVYIYSFYLFKSKDLQNILEDSIIESFPRREVKIVKKSDINSFFLFFLIVLIPLSNVSRLNRSRPWRLPFVAQYVIAVTWPRHVVFDLN